MLILGLLALALPLAACDYPGTYLDDNGHIVDVQVHAEWELTEAHAPWEMPTMETRLDIIMYPPNYHFSPEPAERCDQMGGELIFYPNTSQYICEGVDY